MTSLRQRDSHIGSALILIQDQRTQCQCGKNRICDKICEVTLLKLDPVCSFVWAVLVLWQLLPSCCCCCCCWNSSEQFRELRHGEPERRQLAALRTKPVPRQEVTPAPLHQPHFRALWTSFLRLGSWRGVRRKKLVHGVRVKRRISRFRAASISRCI